MFNSKHLSASLCSFWSSLNLSRGMTFSSFNIGRFSSISFNRSLIGSVLIMRFTPLIDVRRPLENIYPEYAGRRYTLSQRGPHNLYARLRFLNIKGGCRI